MTSAFNVYIFILIPAIFLTGGVAGLGKRMISPNFTVFIFMIGLNLGVIFGIMAGIVPNAILVLSGGLLILDLWKGGVR